MLDQVGIARIGGRFVVDIRKGTLLHWGRGEERRSDGDGFIVFTATLYGDVLHVRFGQTFLQNQLLQL